jgi:deazaflavin-dependent oxidoreductase (nitroreductase family)
MWYNSIIKGLLKSPFHFFVSRNMMLITYTGRKSGEQHTTPVNYFPAQDEQGEYLATTSLAERIWWRNLRGSAPVTVRLKGRDWQASAQVIEDEQGVAEGMYQFLSQSPGVARYFQVALDENGQPDRLILRRTSTGRCWSRPGWSHLAIGLKPSVPMITDRISVFPSDRPGA